MEIEVITDTTVRISGVEHDAQQLSTLIENLALVREELHPPVGPDFDLLKEVASMADPAFKISITPDGRVVLSLRHTGYGWLHFDLDPGASHHLGGQLIRAAGAPMHAHEHPRRH